MKKKLLSLLAGMNLAMMNFAVYASANEVITQIENNSDNTDTEIVGTVGGPIFGAIRVIGIVVAVIMVAYVGIKYLTAGAGGKADVKGNLVPMLAGAALIALAPTLVGWAFGVFGA